MALIEQGRSYDVALIDTVMPDLDGWAARDKLATIAPETRIVMMSG